METTRHWSALFQNWPANLPRRGYVITTLNDAVPFKGFMLSDAMLVLDRTTPDSLGARFVVLPFDTIAAVKLIDAVAEPAFTKLGFVGQFSKL